MINKFEDNNWNDYDINNDIDKINNKFEDNKFIEVNNNMTK